MQARQVEPDDEDDYLASLLLQNTQRFEGEWNCIRWQVCCTTGPNAHEASYIFLTAEFSAGDDAQNRARLLFEHIASAPSSTWSGSRSHVDEKGRGSAVNSDIPDWFLACEAETRQNQWCIDEAERLFSLDDKCRDEIATVSPSLQQLQEQAIGFGACPLGYQAPGPVGCSSC